MRKSLLLGLGLLAAGPLHAEIIEIPKQSGFSGFLLGGVTASSYESNFYKGHDSHDRIDSLGAAERSDGLTPLINADLRYTFADTRTQLFLGNLIQDAVRFDFTQQLGVRQQVGDKGIIAGSYVFSALPGEQWQDPFATGVDRETTDRSSRGMRLSWDKIWGSHFNGKATLRKIDIDNEHSGERYGHEVARQLDRNGREYTFELGYLWQLAPGQLLEPSLIYRQADLDGRAERYNSTGIQLSYGLKQSQWSLVSNLYLGKRDYDAIQPIFGRQADANEFAIGGSFFWHRLFGVAPLSAVVSAGYARADSDIAFYDSNASSLSAGLLYTF
ncbi:DUF2860 family protein [Aeromonas bivalvium]|uniref:DUF2860 family protein n=1 Tax=Aeromonas bivalvium TaxID=440079 RepID=UPI0038CF9402